MPRFRFPTQKIFQPPVGSNVPLKTTTAKWYTHPNELPVDSNSFAYRHPTSHHGGLIPKGLTTLSLLQPMADGD